MTKKIWIDRSRSLDYRRCHRLRYLTYHSGSQHLGLVPVRKSIHLVLGGAVHAGLEVLLRESQAWLNESRYCVDNAGQASTLDQQLQFFFVDSRGIVDGKTVVRQIEDAAVAAALADLAEASKGGVEVDTQEQAAGSQTATAITASTMSARSAGDMAAGVAAGGDSAIMIDFGDWDASSGQFRPAADLRTAKSVTITETMPIDEARKFADKIDATVVGKQDMTLREKLEASIAAVDIVGPIQWAASGEFDSGVLVKAPAVGGSQTGDGLVDVAQVTGGSNPLPTTITTVQRDDWAEPVYIEVKPGKAFVDTVPDSTADALLDQVQVDVARAVAADNQATGMDGYLREELAALVEAMVRSYSRRRLRPLLEQFEVLEVEREGSWKLGEARLPVWVCAVHGDIKESDISDPSQNSFDGQPLCNLCLAEGLTAAEAQVPYKAISDRELWFASRHDALLLERATGYLYLQSYKTTGSWDRRKEQDAAVDMQGLSEAVDVERRMEEAWKLLNSDMNKAYAIAAFAGDDSILRDQEGFTKTLDELVSGDIQRWLVTLPEPPKILGVRYEYLLKGARRQDKRGDLAPNGFPRYVADTPLVRAWKQDGIAAEDRRWQPSYEWWELSGKSRRLDYRSWQKAGVWKFMPVAEWIGMLDSGEVTEGQYDVGGNPVDVLGEQFITPITVYRNSDDMLDMLEQLEAQEQQVAIDVAAVYAVENDYAAMRSELNRRFPQTRAACSYPGSCQMKSVCFGPQAIREDPESSGLYQIRVPNHPQENCA